MAASQEDWIRHRAYQLWEQEGYPSGKDTEHWERAKLEYATLKPVASLKAEQGPDPAKAAPKKVPARGEAKPAAKAKPEAAKPKVAAAAAAAPSEQTKKRVKNPTAH